MPNCKDCGTELSKTPKKGSTGRCRSCAGKRNWKKRTTGRKNYDWVGGKWTSTELYNLACREYGCSVCIEAFRIRLTRWGVERALKGKKPKNSFYATTSTKGEQAQDQDPDLKRRMEVLDSIPGPTKYDKEFSGEGDHPITTIGDAMPGSIKQ